MAEQNKGLAGIFNDPNFITGVSILAANSDPTRHWSEGYKDASERLSAMERSALNRAEMELRKQKFEQEQQAMEAQRAAQERMQAIYKQNLSPSEMLRAGLAAGASPSELNAMQTLVGAERGPEQLADIRLFEYYQSLPEGPEKEQFGRKIGVSGPTSIPNQTEFERLLPDYQRLSAKQNRTPEEEARYQALGSKFGLLDPAKQREEAIARQEDFANVEFNKKTFADNLRQMEQAKTELIEKAKERGAAGLSRKLTFGQLESAAEMDALLDEFTGEIALQALKDLKLSGATLGQVTEKELAMLRAELGGINAQSGPDFIEAQVNKAFANFRTRVINRLEQLEQQKGMSAQPSGAGSSGFRIVE